MKQATYCVVHLEPSGRYMAFAWGDNVLLGTSDHPTYADARAELNRLAQETDVSLRWFDGEHKCPAGVNPGFVAGRKR